MIRFTLACTDGHSFDSWFASGSAYESLKASGHVACAVCGSTSVDKALMAPAVRTDEARPSLSGAVTPQEQAAAALRKKLQENADYVGLSFASEARAIHDGDAPERAIWGEARLDEARQLLEDGIPVAPLPFLPKAKSN